MLVTNLLSQRMTVFIGISSCRVQAAYCTVTARHACLCTLPSLTAGDLFDNNSRLGRNAKSVLVEKGGLAFPSHCLNTARGYGEDRGQQNDTFFALFKFKVSDQSKLWTCSISADVMLRGVFSALVFTTNLYKEILN